MKIIVDEMPNYPYECRNCRQEGDMEFHYWVCEDFTLALGKRLYPNGVSYPPNRAERRKLKRKKQ